MKFFFSFLIFFLHTFLLFSQDSVAYRIVLIGDGGELTNGHHPVAEAVKKIIPMDERTTIIYLGDNLYKHGLPDDQTLGYKEAKAVLDSQLSIADNTPAQIYMIPGNHDWNNGARNGYDAIVREQLYVDLLNKKNVHFLPKGGCPGPEEVKLGPDVTLVIFDSQWWIHPYDKPGIESDCDFKTEDEVLTQLDDIFSRNSKQLVIFACHHTFKSHSPHAGYYTLRQHIFPFTDMLPWLYIPLPVIGSIYPITRGVFGTPQDLKHPRYANMISRIQEKAKNYRNIIFTAGHEHTLQLIQDSSYNYIVSGSGSKTTQVFKGKKSLFAAAETGFCVLEVSKNKNVRTTFYTVTDSIRNVFSDNILNFSTIEKPADSSSINRVVENSSTIKFEDTITFTASDKYITHSALKKFIMGTNYRQEWATPVNMKVFNLSKEKGGLKTGGLGGGKQTKSLKLTDATGKEWVLRTVDKDPAKAIPAAFRPTAAADVVKDFISASHPYAAMTVPVLAEALDLTVAKPELFFVPEDPAFGLYKNIFKNTICFLEESKPSRHGEETNSTIKVFNKLIEENDHRADQLAVLRARLLDILIADFDRHFDQWRWATGDTGKGKLYYPIPKDRDQAFFYSNGFLMKLVSSKVLRFLKGFRYTIPDVNGLGEVARDFDRVFLTDLDAKEWETTIKEVQDKLNDTVINTAIKKLPPEIYAIDGDVLTKKLISRRNLLEKAGMTYYKFISKKVNIVGSNEKEYFKLTSNPDGLNVKVYGRKENKDTSFLMYDRTFDHKVTKEIRLYGLNDDDLFDIDEKASSRIKVRVIGGKGNDTFNIRGNVRNYLYDLDPTIEKNYIKNRSHSHYLFSKEPPVNYYNILGFKYNRTNFPSFELAANNDDGLLVGTGFSRKAYGFRNEPYVSYQKFAALYAVNRGGRQFKYSGIFNHAIRNTDIILLSEVMDPGISNFFGLGNNTTLDSSITYYRARFRHMETQMLFQKRFYETLRIMAGPVVYMYWNKLADNTGKVLGNPSLIGLDPLSVYSNKSYAGGKIAININNLNNVLFPTRGVQWNTDLISLAGISKTSKPITTLQSDMAVYASLNDPARLVAVLQFGAGHIFTKHFEYFQAMTLGSHNYLRGFRKNRFAGSSIAYGSIELRLKLVDVKSYILPGSFGLVGFNETGRVWLKGESSQRWHYAYGGGFYFIPFNLFLMSATIGYSKEEHLLNFSVGTKLNLTF